MTTFKIGDRVKIIDAGHPWHGSEATIARIATGTAEKLGFAWAVELVDDRAPPGHQAFVAESEIRHA